MLWPALTVHAAPSWRKRGYLVSVTMIGAGAASMPDSATSIHKQCSLRLFSKR